MTSSTLLTILFIYLKLTGSIDWHWALVLLPGILYFIFWLILQIWWESKTPLEKYKFRQGLR